MRSLVLFLALFVVAGNTFASKTGKLIVHIKDPLRSPVVSAKVELGDKIVFTDTLGNALFEEVELKKDFTLKISSENSIYLSKEERIHLITSIDDFYCILNWTKVHWDTELSVVSRGNNGKAAKDF